MRVRTTTMPAAATALALAGALLLAAGAAPRAEEATTTPAETKSEVTILRGGGEATADQQPVTVIRGEAPVPEAPVAEEAYVPPIVASGRYLWIYDPVEETVTACYLRYTYYPDRRVVRCTGRDSYSYASSSGARSSFARASFLRTTFGRTGFFRAGFGRAPGAQAPGAPPAPRSGVIRR